MAVVCRPAEEAQGLETTYCQREGRYLSPKFVGWNLFPLQAVVKKKQQQQYFTSETKIDFDLFVVIQELKGMGYKLHYLKNVRRCCIAGDFHRFFPFDHR